MLAADNLTITRKMVAAALREMDPRPIRDLVSRMQKAGAEIIDINSGPLTREPEKKMGFLVETVQEVTDLPIMLDSSNPKALEAGLRMGRGKIVINGFSLEPEKLARILPLALKYQADIVGYLLYPNGQVPMNAEDLTDLAIQVHGAAIKAGLDEERLIIDPVIAPLMWENGLRHNRHVLVLLRNLPDLLGFPVRTIAGLSNLTAGPGPKEKKQVLAQAFLPMLAAVGLSHVLLNILDPAIVGIAQACRTLSGMDIFTWAEVVI